MMIDCIQLDRDCADVCKLALSLMARDSQYVTATCQLCASICRACAEECKKHNVEHCQACAKTCDNCANECERMTT